MNMKKLLALALVLELAVKVSGCIIINPPGTKRKPTENENITVKEDLQNYIEAMTPLASLEAEAVGAYDDVSGDNYTDDNTMLDAVKNTVLPKYTSLVNQVKAIDPQTKEVQDVHDLYVQAAETQLSAFHDIIEALEEQDMDIVTRANGKLADAREGMADFDEQLTALAEQYNVDLN